MEMHLPLIPTLYAGDKGTVTAQPAGTADLGILILYISQSTEFPPSCKKTD